MANMLVDDRDQKFMLFEQLEIGKFSESELFADFDSDTYEMVLNEAKKQAETEFMPTNAEGDKEGAVLKDGQVYMPESFHKLWRLWNEGEWRGMDIPQEYGGQGMPTVVGMAANEFFEAANLAFQTCVAMPRGGALLIAEHGSEEQIEKYVGKILSGEWTSTMDLTESDAGSDVGNTKTTAEKNPDGTYSIRGSKVFITHGDTDLAKNVIHLALARVKGAPSGTRGLSLFLIPKYRINQDGSIGRLNDVKTVAVEKKMGLKGSATCQMSFGEENGCIGELVGEENKGMAIFFTMMNESRLIAARHAQSVASTAYRHAIGYARERIQGTEAGKPADSPRVPIIKHPDIRRMLLMMKSYTEGMRALIFYTSYCIDREKIAKDEKEQNFWESRTSFLTPVAKAYVSDMSFRVTETAMQVYGGYGYTKDYPIEQFLRDEKVHSIFEGTNGIQSFDLTGRKLGRDSEFLFNGHLADIEKFCKENKNHKNLSKYISVLKSGKDALEEASKFLLNVQKENIQVLALYSVQYLELFGDITVGWLLLWQAVIAQEKLDAIVKEKNIGDGDDLKKFIAENMNASYYYGKLASAKYFINNIVSFAQSKASNIKNADTTAIEMPEEVFN